MIYECEHSISCLQYLKTYLQSTMQESHLNGLAMLYIHRDIPCEVDKVVDTFGGLHLRQMQLVN